MSLTSRFTRSLVIFLKKLASRIGFKQAQQQTMKPDTKRSYPSLDGRNNRCESPHLVILGAGASIAACPDGDANGFRLPSMDNFVDVLNLTGPINHSGANYDGENFEDFYDNLVSNGQHPALINEIETKVEQYFSGLRLPSHATVYDYLILSLREKDLIATFNWDPFLAQAYQRNIDVVGFESMPKLVFLHGNVAIGICRTCRTKGWRFNTCNCGEKLEPSKLLYPISQKNYSADEFIENEWQEVQAYLEHAYFVTIFGYSAPKTDAEARQLMLNCWQRNRTTDFAQVDIIDIKPRVKVERNWSDFFIRENYMIVEEYFRTQLAVHPRRSCDAFAMATLQQNPWKENRVPSFDSLTELQNWMQPLILEERVGKFSGKPCAT